MNIYRSNRGAAFQHREDTGMTDSETARLASDAEVARSDATPPDDSYTGPDGMQTLSRATTLEPAPGAGPLGMDANRTAFDMDGVAAGNPWPLHPGAAPAQPDLQDAAERTAAIGQ